MAWSWTIFFRWALACWVLQCLAPFAGAQAREGRQGLPPLPATARLVLSEDWSSGRIERERWYPLRKKWGQGNHGVVPENVRVEPDEAAGPGRKVLVCEAHGDAYDGPVTGENGQSTRVGGVLVSKEFFASGRFEVTMKIGRIEPSADEAAEPAMPRGAVPAIWLFGYRYVQVPAERMHEFVPSEPLYNPHMPAYGTGANEYWSEIDFPELGKQGDFAHGLYNTFCQNRYDWQTLAIPDVADGRYHTYVTEWRTDLRPLAEVTDADVVEHAGFWWVRNRAIAFDKYLGNPLRRLAADRYAVCCGTKAEHWLDGIRVGENTRHVPCMAAQLNLGVWLPEWGGEAPWKTARVSFAGVRVWQYDDPGDVRGILTEDIADNIAAP